MYKREVMYLNCEHKANIVGSGYRYRAIMNLIGESMSCDNKFHISLVFLWIQNITLVPIIQVHMRLDSTSITYYE